MTDRIPADPNGTKPKSADSDEPELAGDGAPSAAEPMFTDPASFIRHYLAPVVEWRVTQSAATGVNYARPMTPAAATDARHELLGSDVPAFDGLLAEGIEGVATPGRRTAAYA